MRRASFDTAKNLDLYFRKLRNGSKLLTFTDSEGEDYDLTGIDFEFRSGFSVTVTVEDNTILLEFSESEIVPRETYFWELVNTTSGKTWLCGNAYFTDTHSAEHEDTTAITIALSGETINITINESGSISDVNGGTA